MRQAIITGHQGFIGSHLWEHMAETWVRTGIDIKSGLDIRHPDIACQIPENSDVLIHLAAIPGVRTSIEQSEEVMSTNVYGTQNLLHAATARGVKHFVFISSSSAEEDHVRSPYGASKLAGEALCLAHHRRTGLPITVLRPFSVYGPGMRESLAIMAFIRAYQRDEPLTIYGDGTQERDYTYVDDVVRGIAQAAAKPPVNWWYELGAGNPARLIDVALRIGRILAYPPTIRYAPADPADVQSTRARDTPPGWTPTIMLDEGIRQTIRWAEANG